MNGSKTGPSTWNSLPDSLRDSVLSLSIFRRQLKTHIFAETYVAHERLFVRLCCINLH